LFDNHIILFEFLTYSADVASTFATMDKHLPSMNKNAITLTGWQINDAWVKVLNKEARYRFVIDAATF
jgi:hypothetical protein